MAPGLPNGQGKGGGAGAGQKDGTTVKKQWGGVGPWVKGGKGLGHGGDSDITHKYS